MKRFRPQSMKLSELKVPGPVQDVYFDLRERRLLPLIALIVVAILAVPFLLKDGSDEAAAPPSASAPPVASASGAAANLTVVRSNPGLRDYRRRLAGRRATNPFKQRYTTVNLSGAQLNPQTESGGGSSDTTVTETTVTEGSGGSVESEVTVESGGAGTPGKSGGAGTPGDSTEPSKGNDKDVQKGDQTFYTFAIDVQIAKTGGKNGKKQEPVRKERVLPLTPLPGEKTPVVTYMGASKKDKALLLVSTEVRSVFGDAKCATGEDVCQLLEVETDLPVVFVYGAGETRYRINVLKIEPVVTGHG